MNASRSSDPARLIAAHRVANEFYRSHLLDEPRALAYLHSRGIVAASASTAPWTIGYAPAGWTILRDHLRANGFTDAELLDAGLITTARNGNHIDVFRDRVTFPIRNAQGDVVAFTGRDLSGRDGTPKYRNTTTTAIYHKSALLYGLAEQLPVNPAPSAVLLVEGPADTVALASTHGDRKLLLAAPCGTALTANQVELLASTVPAQTPLVLAFDADAAGQAALDKAYRLVRRWPGPIEAIMLPTGTDPAFLVARHGAAQAAATLHDARRPLADVVLEHQLAPRLRRLDEREQELTTTGRDPGLELFIRRVDTVRSVAPLLADVAHVDPNHAARLSVELALRLHLEPLTVLEAVFPPQDASDEAASAPDPPPRPAMAMGTRGYPDPSIVGHEFARACPPDAPAATWVEHDPHTGHTAWVLCEGVGVDPADRDAAHLAAEVAGRSAVLVGAYKAVEIARHAVNAAFAEPGVRQGNASIVVVCSFDGDRPQPGAGQFTVAWAGDAGAYATASPDHARTVADTATVRNWFAAVTVDHTVTSRHPHAISGRQPASSADRARASQPGGQRSPAGGQLLTASVRGGAIGLNRLDLPPTSIVLAGRRTTAVGIERLRAAVEPRRPDVTLANLRQLAGRQTIAIVVRPDAARQRDVMTAARLARQDLAGANVPHHQTHSAARQAGVRLTLPPGPANTSVSR
ncbi:toprim domain-containing protein [Dactylosporangium sp. CA-233914]|uniref:toprim domain-containing protein n=1 Tax=Dactylosporangium sp. CA-233914 TaxID=3239934 RepID=UPI003D94E47D